MALSRGQVAQLVEQGIENPRVGGSIPSLATILKFFPNIRAFPPDIPDALTPIGRSRP
jgi:hypothetical protein